MSKEKLTIKAFDQKVFAKGTGEFIRTVPMKGDRGPYIGFIKTTQGEVEVPYGNEIVFEVLVSGEEITEDEYNNGELMALNDLG